MTNKIQYTFTSKGLSSGQELIVIDFKGFEAISRPYEYTINLKSQSPDIDMDTMLEKPCTFTMKVGGHKRMVHGVLSEFEELHQIGQFIMYRAVLVPGIWKLSLYHANEIYLHDKNKNKGTTVPDIIEIVLKECGFTTDDYSMNLKESQQLIGDEASGYYKRKPYRCQWNESHLNYISRLMEHVGIYYYFDQGEKSEKIIFCDEKFNPNSAKFKVNYSPVSGMDIHTASNNLQSLVCRKKRMPHTVKLQDYNYEKPSLDVSGTAVVDEKGVGEVFVYGENFETPEEGEQLAKIRAQEIFCKKERFYGQSMVSKMETGYLFEVKDHFRDSFNQKYLIISIDHEGKGPSFLTDSESESQDIAPSYTNSFTAISSTVQFRPERITPKSKFHGMINAVVDGEQDGKYAELDEQGRYKIKLPFDRETEREPGNASYWFRKAEPHAGPNEGTHFPLRKHTEVLMSFIDGDPDRPVISSAIANPASPNVVRDKNQTSNVIKTSSGNMIEMEDQNGDNRLKLYSPEAKSYMHFGAPNHPGKGIVMLTQGVNRVEIAGGYQWTYTTEDEYIKLLKKVYEGEISDDADSTTDDSTEVADNIFGEKVDSVEVTNPGSAYTSIPAVTFTATSGGEGATAEVGTIKVESINVTNPDDNEYSIIPEVQISDKNNGEGRGATASVHTMKIKSIRVTEYGSGYEIDRPKVTIAPPNFDNIMRITPSTAEAEVSKVTISSIELQGQSQVFQPDVDVNISGGSPVSNENATRKLTMTIQSIHITNAGSYENKSAAVKITGSEGSSAKATAIFKSYTYIDQDHNVQTKYKVSSIQINNHGSGYVPPFTVEISGSAEAEVDGVGIDKIEIIDGGTYLNMPTAEVSDGTTTQDTTVKLGIKEINITTVNNIKKEGSGYQATKEILESEDIITIDDPSSGTTAEAVINTIRVESVIVDHVGEKYSIPSPSLDTLASECAGVSFGDDGEVTKATANVNTVQIDSIRVIAPGDGYKQPPTVTIGDPIPPNPLVPTDLEPATALGKAYLRMDQAVSEEGEGGTDNSWELLTDDKQGTQDVFTRSMILSSYTLYKRNADGTIEGIDPETKAGDKDELEPESVREKLEEADVNINESKSEIRGRYLIERRLGEYHFYSKGNEYLFRSPNESGNKTFVYGSSFRVIHKDEDGNTKSLIDDLGAGNNYDPDGTLDFSTNTEKSWQDIINKAHVSLAEHDTITGQKGNIYDFGGYWNYNLGNCYVENHLYQNQDAKLNAVYDYDILAKGGPNWCNEETAWRTVTPRLEQGKEPIKESLSNEIMDKACDASKVNGKGWRNIWVEKKFGDSYEYTEGSSISITKGSSQEIKCGGKHVEITIGGEHIEKKYAGDTGQPTYYSRSQSGKTWEKKYNRTTGGLVYDSYTHATGGFTYEASKHLGLKHSFELYLSGVSSISLFGAGKFDLSLSGGINIDLKFSASLDFGLDFSMAAGVKASGKWGGQFDYNVVTRQLDAKMSGLKAQKLDSLNAEAETLKIKKQTGIIDQATFDAKKKALKFRQEKLGMKNTQLDVTL